MTNRSNFQLDQSELDIISTFELQLEQIFLTDTSVVISKSDNNLINLVIEVDAQFVLHEVMALLNVRSDLTYQQSGLNKMLLRFKNAFFTLNQTLYGIADIEELSLYFKDTSIVINSISQNSIIDEIDDIAKAVLKHHKYLSTLMGLLPSEIHIPVFEDTVTKELFNKNEKIVPINYKSAYLQYWGVYFDSYDKPLVYNLKRTNIMPGDLDLSFD